jgi:hypothetical protein
MRKILIAVAIAAFASYNVYRSNNNETEGMSDTMLANVEALAGGGERYGSGTCYGTGIGGTNQTCYGGDKICCIGQGNVFGKN